MTSPVNSTEKNEVSAVVTNGSEEDKKATDNGQDLTQANENVPKTIDKSNGDAKSPISKQQHQQPPARTSSIKKSTTTTTTTTTPNRTSKNVKTENKSASKNSPTVAIVNATTTTTGSSKESTKSKSKQAVNNNSMTMSVYASNTLPSSSRGRTRDGGLHQRTYSTPSPTASRISSARSTASSRAHANRQVFTRSIHCEKLCFLKEMMDPSPLVLTYDEQATTPRESTPIRGSATSCVGLLVQQDHLRSRTNTQSSEYALANHGLRQQRRNPKQTVLSNGRIVPKYFSIHPEFSSEKVVLVSTSSESTEPVRELPCNLDYPFTPRIIDVRENNPTWPRRCRSVPPKDYQDPITWLTKTTDK